MACATRKCPLIIHQFNGQRHGHMVKLPGNTWRLRDWIKRPKKRWIPVKGTMGYKLDTIVPSDDLRHWSVDPVLKLYSYQVDVYPKTKCCDPVYFLCNLTRTAEPVTLPPLTHCVDRSLLLDFVSHVEGCCSSFNGLLHQKEVKVSSNKRTPLQLDHLARHYSTAFLQNVLLFLFSRQETCGPLLADSYLSGNHHTAAFWRHSVLKYENACHTFQFTNFIDLMVRSTKVLSHSLLAGQEHTNTQWAHMEETLQDVCKKRLVLFNETRQVEQYPGFIKETIFPYNHTLFKVVSSDMSDRDLQAAALMTGFGQTVATTQHRLDFPCRVDLLPAIGSGEAVNVVVTDGNRYCLGVYQCNTTNMCGTQLSRDGNMTSRDVNMCALSPVQSLVSQGQLNVDLLANLLGLLTAQPDQLGLAHSDKEDVYLETDNVR